MRRQLSLRNHRHPTEPIVMRAMSRVQGGKKENIPIHAGFNCTPAPVSDSRSIVSPFEF